MKRLMCVLLLLLAASMVYANSAPKITDIKVRINNVEVEPWTPDGYIADYFWMQYGIYCPQVYCLDSCGV